MMPGAPPPPADPTERRAASWAGCLGCGALIGIVVVVGVLMTAGVVHIAEAVF